jgi:UDP-glucose 4-epimerase
MKKAIVTGAGGYIGGQTAIHLHDLGWQVVGIDRNHPPKHLANSTFFSKFLMSEVDSEDSINLITDTDPDILVHCAGSTMVGESMSQPAEYYQNNFVKTKYLVEYMIQNRMKTRFVFSSTAATYGEPLMSPCYETDPPLPINPYGQSKLMVEMMLESYRLAYGLDYVAFRYFNVCGADPDGRHGQKDNASHIIAKVLEAIRDNKEITINGSAYDTHDGTCLRDYVHVSDIASAHALADQHIHSGIYNLGTSTGYSNKQIVEAAFRVTGKEVPVKYSAPRAGDPATLLASPEKINAECGWQVKYNLDDIIAHAWAWYNK